MNVSLTPELERLVQSKVESGMYQTASEVVREALRLLHEHEEIRQRRIEQLNRDTQIGLDQAANGNPFDGEQVFAELLEHNRTVRKGRS